MNKLDEAIEREVRPWLDLVDSLRAQGIQNELSLPQVWLCGQRVFFHETDFFFCWCYCLDVGDHVFATRQKHRAPFTAVPQQRLFSLCVSGRWGASARGILLCENDPG